MATISKTFPHNNTQLGSKPWLFPRRRMTANVLGQDMHVCLAHKYKMHGKWQIYRILKLQQASEGSLNDEPKKQTFIE